MATPTATGISGKKISNAGSGLSVNWETTKMIAAETMAAYVNHFSCCRSTGPARRYRGISETAPSSSTKA
jgi:hypothetical protein